MKTIISIFVFCSIIESVLASAAIPMGSSQAARLVGGGRVNEAVPMGSREAARIVGGGRINEAVPVGSREAASSLLRGKNSNSNFKGFGGPDLLRDEDSFYAVDEVDLIDHLKEKVKEVELKEKLRGEQAAVAYDKLAEERIKKHVFDSSSSFSECVKKIKMHVVEVEDIREAGTLAKKQASTDSNYIIKQITLSPALSNEKISTTQPYYLDDPMRYDYEIYEYPDIKYKKKIITKYPKEGISTKRNYKFITLAKKTTDKEIEFEEGEVVFVQRGLDLNVKMNQLRCVTMTGNIPNDVIKKVINQHNKEIEKKKKE